LSATGIFIIEFPVHPRITPFDFGDQQIYDGQTAQLACMVLIGDMPIEISWTFEGKKLSQSMGYRISQVGPRSSILLIDPVEPIHGGKYMCIAKNPSGNDTHQATLRVHG
jgi:hypothetical protein